MFDAIIVGAGPAGLAAATYLARFRRRALVLDGGASRARWIPESHNTPGFPMGVSGETLLARLRAQALEFGAEIRPALAETLVREDGAFRLRAGGASTAARTVLLATGVLDRLPPLEGIEAAIRAGQVRMCPICDAFEAVDRRIAVLADGNLGARELAFLRDYSHAVTLLALTDLAAAANGAVRIAMEDLTIGGDGVHLRSATGPERHFDHLYLALGCAPQAELAMRCGARTDTAGALLVDAHQMTTVPGLYAAGDVVRGLNQIAVATGEAAVAATDMHNRLRPRNGSAGAS